MAVRATAELMGFNPCVSRNSSGAELPSVLFCSVAGFNPCVSRNSSGARH